MNSHIQARPAPVPFRALHRSDSAGRDILIRGHSPSEPQRSHEPYRPATVFDPGGGAP